MRELIVFEAMLLVFLAFFLFLRYAMGRRLPNTQKGWLLKHETRSKKKILRGGGTAGGVCTVDGSGAICRRWGSGAHGLVGGLCHGQSMVSPIDGGAYGAVYRYRLAELDSLGDRFWIWVLWLVPMDLAEEPFSGGSGYFDPWGLLRGGDGSVSVV